MSDEPKLTEDPRPKDGKQFYWQGKYPTAADMSDDVLKWHIELELERVPKARARVLADVKRKDEIQQAWTETSKQHEADFAVLNNYIEDLDVLMTERRRRDKAGKRTKRPR